MDSIGFGAQHLTVFLHVLRAVDIDTGKQHGLR